MSKFLHGFSSGDEVTITVHLSGKINDDGDLYFDYTLDKPWKIHNVGDQQDFCEIVTDNGSEVITEADLARNRDELYLRPYDTPMPAAVAPVSDDDLKDALASILGRPV